MAMSAAQRRELHNARRHRCPACGRLTVRKRTYLPFPDERCGACRTAGFMPQVTAPVDHDFAR